MTTLTHIPADQRLLLDAITFYEGYRKLAAGHFTTSPVTNNNGTHLHLRDYDAPHGKRFYGIAVPNADGVRITRTGACPLCRGEHIPTGGYVVRYEQIGVTR